MIKMKPLYHFQANLTELTEQIQRGESQLTWRTTYIFHNTKNWKTWFGYILLMPECFMFLVGCLWVWERMPIWFNILTIIFWGIWFYLPFSPYSHIGIGQKIQWDRVEKQLTFRNRYRIQFIYKPTQQHDSLVIHTNGLTLYYDYGKTQNIIIFGNLYPPNIQKDIYSKIKILAQAIADDYGLTIIDELPEKTTHSENP